MIDLKGQTAVVFGLANKRSIAWAIALKLSAAGAQLAICYQNERLRPEAEALAGELTGAAIFQCDVTSDQEIDAVFAQLKQRYGKIQILVHSVAFAPADELHNDFLMTSREGFKVAHEISVYSLIALARGAAPLMTDGGSIITMTYYGSQKVIPRYNVMGVAKAALEATVRYLAADLGPKKIRVNAISAGVMKTLAARGIGGLSEMMKLHAERAPLKRTVESTEVGNAALFLASDLSGGVTGDVLYVDCGYNTVAFATSELPGAKD
jgi:enoyl-[acyl-carrier protein] reductase I